MSPEGDDLAIILFRVQALESGLRDFSKRVDRQYEQLHASINALAFVPLGLYLSEKANLVKDMDSLGKDIEDARKMALGAFGTIATAVIGAVLIAVVSALR